jgi:hypothetical protein
MFICTRLWLMIHPAMHKGKDHLTFDACLRVGTGSKMALRLDVEYNKALKSTLKRQAAEEARNDTGWGKAHHKFGKGRSSQSTSVRIVGFGS